MEAYPTLICEICTCWKKKLENVSVSVEMRITKALKFVCGKAHKWRSYRTGFLSYDLTALGFPVMTFLHGGIEFSYSDSD